MKAVFDSLHYPVYGRDVPICVPYTIIL